MPRRRQHYSSLGLSYRNLYLGEIADGELDVPAHARKQIDLKNQVLLNQIQILLVVPRNLHFRISSIELQNKS